MDSSSGSSGIGQWLQGAFIALACGAVYIAVRPPLFDIDGYPDRLAALGPDRFQSVQPHHLLWSLVQILIADAAKSVGDPSTFPFQVVGILVNCATLFFLFVLLQRVSDNLTSALAGVLVTAFSPDFWYLGFQNRPYTLMSLAIVLYLLAWNTDRDAAPTGWRLTTVAVLLALAIFMQQAAVFLVPAAILALLVQGPAPWRRRMARAAIWGGALTAFVLVAYLAVWVLACDQVPNFIRWITEYVETEHSFDLIDYGLGLSLIKGVVGVSGDLIQSAQIQSFLDDHVSSNGIVAIYAAFGAAAALGVLILAWLNHLERSFTSLICGNALFRLSLLSIVFWSLFAFAWEPATSHFWLPDLFFALVCIATILRDSGALGRRALLAIALLMAGWNWHFNCAYDRTHARNTPEPLVAAIEQHVGRRDIFIVLGHNDWFGNMDYDLLFDALNNARRNPGLAILEDFVLPGENSPTWSDRLLGKIEEVMNSGGRVFVASHVFDPASYEDLAGRKDPFAPFVNKQYAGLDGEALCEQISQVFAPYDREGSDLKIGVDGYFVLSRRPAGESGSPHNN